MDMNVSAILLSARDSGAADRIAIFFTKEQGKMRVFCPGSRRKSGRGGLLQPFALLDLQVDRQREGYRLLEARTLRDSQNIWSDWDRMSYGAVIAEAIDILWPEEEAQEELFDFLDRAFEVLEIRSPRIVAGAALWKILELAGFGAELTGCIECGSQLHEGCLSAEGGGVIGSCCGLDPLAPQISQETLRALQTLQNYPWDEKEISGSISGKDLIEAEKILLHYLYHHSGRNFRSLEFFQKQRNI